MAGAGAYMGCDVNMGLRHTAYHVHICTDITSHA